MIIKIVIYHFRGQNEYTERQRHRPLEYILQAAVFSYKGRCEFQVHLCRQAQEPRFVPRV